MNQIDAHRPLASAELEMVRLVMQLGQATVKEVCEMLPPERDLGYKTVQTLLRRAEHKGFLTHKENGRAHVFVPTTSEKNVLDETVGNFIKRQFRGDAYEMAKCLVDGHHLTEDDLRRLRKRIKKKVVQDSPV